ncbi:cyclin-like protein [Limtongia smithiae]|uniref:cyclin-like protein n=1 Tax=Limtongia smithiae TaxID=1125753 RepID=UPI0034CF88A0
MASSLPPSAGDYSVVPTHMPSLIQLSRPLLSHSQIASLQRQAGNQTPTARDSQAKFAALQLISGVSNSLRFPIRTMGSAMILFHRFYLFNTIYDFSNVNDTALACLFVAAKMQDTLKKLKDILVASQQVLRRSSPAALIDADSPYIEEQRRRLIPLERHVLETMSFDFRMGHPQKYLIKFAKALDVPVDVAEVAWTISVDSYKSTVHLTCTSHAIALACIYIGIGLSDQDNSSQPLPRPPPPSEGGNKPQENSEDDSDAPLYEPSIPIDSDQFLVPRAEFHNAILEILEFYIDWLPQTSLASRYTDSRRFMNFRIAINKRASTAPPTDPTQLNNYRRRNHHSREEQRRSRGRRDSKNGNSKHSVDVHGNGNGNAARHNGYISTDDADDKEEDEDPDPQLRVHLRDNAASDLGMVRYVFDWSRDVDERRIVHSNSSTRTSSGGSRADPNIRYRHDY